MSWNVFNGDWQRWLPSSSPMSRWFTELEVFLKKAFSKGVKCDTHLDGDMVRVMGHQLDSPLIWVLPSHKTPIGVLLMRSSAPCVLSWWTDQGQLFVQFQPVGSDQRADVVLWIVYGGERDTD